MIRGGINNYSNNHGCSVYHIVHIMFDNYISLDFTGFDVGQWRPFIVSIEGQQTVVP